MSSKTEAAPTRPLPAPDDITRPYWEAAARGELLIQECPACGHRQFYPRALCTSCAATPEWRTSSGRGTVYTFTVIRQNYSEPFRSMMPYIVAMVELEEGPRLMSNITDCSPEEVSIGMPVEVWFEPLEEGLAIPLFRPAGAA